LVTPKYRMLPKSYTEADIINFIIGANLRRRDLNPGQKASIIVDIEGDLEAAAAKERQREAGGDKKSLKRKDKSKDRSAPRGAKRSRGASKRLAAKGNVGTTTITKTKAVKGHSPCSNRARADPRIHCQQPASPCLRSSSWRRHMAEPAITPAPIIGVTAPTSFSLPPGPPQYDVIERLPEDRKDLLRKLRQHRADKHALVPEFETIREASMARVEAEHALKRLTDHPQDGGFNLPDDNRSVIAAKRTLEKATDDFERLKQLQEVRSAAFQSASAALAAVESWLRDGVPGNCTLETVEVEPKLNKGESALLDAIENRRRRVRELRADLHRIASAPFPSAYCKAKMRTQVEALAMQGAPSASRLVELDGKIEFQTQRLTSEVHAEQRALAFAQVPDTVALVAWLHKDALVKRLDAEIDAEADDKAALSHADRELRTAETMGDLLDIERQEAALTWSAIGQGLPCEFRADCSPIAILGLKLVTTPRTSALPGTTPGLSWPWR
jgi:hypothetical protein